MCFSVSVALSVSVESAMECQMGVDEVFCGASLSGMMQSAMSVLLEKPSSGVLKQIWLRCTGLVS